MNSKNTSPEKIALRRKYPPTFGRRKSRSLTDTQQKLMKEYLPEYRIAVDDGSLDKLVSEIKGKQVFLEIGFGGGEHVVHQALLNPDVIIIGCEIYINSFALCIQRAHKAGLTNIRLFNNDVRYLVEKLPGESIDKVYVLFPDPWPKQRQFKRRIVNQQMLDMIYPVLKNKGKIRLATDIDSYFNSMQRVFGHDNRFRLITDSAEYINVPVDHIITKYHSKALKEGRIPRFIEYVKL